VVTNSVQTVENYRALADFEVASDRCRSVYWKILGSEEEALRTFLRHASRWYFAERKLVIDCSDSRISVP
jgi:hypothetical protein